MVVFDKSPQDIDENDLQTLIRTTHEGKHIDFKKAAYPQPSKDKDVWRKEFCADVVSFANADGGYIICGIEEHKGKASNLCGLGANFDAEGTIQRLEQCALSGIEPPLHNLLIRPVDLQDPTKELAIVIYIPKSFSGPHRVKETQKFHIRRSNSKGEMHVNELREAYTLMKSLRERIQAFRDGRVQTIEMSTPDDEVPVTLANGVRHILHVIPVSSFASNTSYDLEHLQPKILQEWQHYTVFSPIKSTNLNGIALWVATPNDPSDSEQEEYAQIFHDGSIEVVNILSPEEYSDGKKSILLSWIERLALDGLDVATNNQRTLGIQPPLFVSLRLLGMNGLRLEDNRKDSFTGKSKCSEPFTRNNLTLPDMELESYDEDIRMVLKPVFDRLWNSGGWARSESYDENRNWIRKNY